jgi:hypothetical protein
MDEVYYSQTNKNENYVLHDTVYRLQQGSHYFKNVIYVSWYTWSIFTKLTNAEQHYVHTSYAKFPKADDECAKCGQKFGGTWWHSWLRNSVTNRKDMDFIPDGHWNFSLT